MDAMAASIAHEINQPLAAMVTNANAAVRWLTRATPDLDEARAALGHVVDDGHRAGEVIGGIRSMFKKGATGDCCSRLTTSFERSLQWLSLTYGTTEYRSQLSCAMASHNCLPIEANCSRYF